MYSWVLWYLITWTPVRLTFRHCTQTFTVCQVLPQAFIIVLPYVTHFFAESTCTLFAKKMVLMHQFFAEGVKVKCRHWCVCRADLTMNSVVVAIKTQEKFQNTLLMHIEHPFLCTNPFVNTTICKVSNRILFVMSCWKISATHFTIVGYDIPIGL